MKRFLLAALLAIALPTAAQTATWKVDAPGSCTVTCSPSATPPPGPVDPTPPPPPPPPPPPSDPCADMSPQFNAALAHQPPLELWAFMFRMGRGLTDAERACARARNVPGSTPPPPTGDNSTPGIPTTGFILANKGRPLTNTLTAGVTYSYSIPNTVKGERVQIGTLEVVGTPDSMVSIGTVRGPNGDILLGPTTFGRHGHHVIPASPGGTLTLTLTPNVTAPLGVLRN